MAVVEVVEDVAHKVTFEVVAGRVVVVVTIAVVLVLVAGVPFGTFIGAGLNNLVLRTTLLTIHGILVSRSTF